MLKRLQFQLFSYWLNRIIRESKLLCQKINAEELNFIHFLYSKSNLPPMIILAPILIAINILVPYLRKDLQPYLNGETVNFH